MTTLTINSETTLQAAIGELREQFRTRKYVTLKISAGKRRTLNQNDVVHAWYEQVARELREDDARGVKRFCKLHFGVPILRAEDEDFRAVYDSTVKGMTYEQKLKVMDLLPVTSLMKTGQLSAYMETLQDHYRGRGVTLRVEA
jgi:hypothetical protein